MDTMILEKFHSQLMEEDNYETAISIRNMLNDLPKYLPIRIKEKYETEGYSPFESMWIHEHKTTRVAVFEGFKFKDNSFALNIDCQENKYMVFFLKRSGENEEFGLKEFLEKISVIDKFSFSENNNHLFFKIKEENLLYDFIDSLLEKLKQMK